MGTLHRRSAAGSTRAPGTTRTATATTTTAAAAAAAADGATGDLAIGVTTPTPCSLTGKERQVLDQFEGGLVLGETLQMYFFS